MPYLSPRAAYDEPMPVPLLIATNWVTEQLFESPWMIIMGLALVWAVLRVAGRRTGNTRLMRLSWVALALLVGLWALAAVVTTPREAIRDRLDALLLAVEHKQIEDYEDIVLPEATTQFLGMQMTRDQVKRLVESADVKDLLITAATIDVQSDEQAAAYIRVRASGTVADGVGVNLSEWAIRWRYEDGQWRALRFECTSVGLQNIFGQDKAGDDNDE